MADENNQAAEDIEGDLTGRHKLWRVNIFLLTWTAYAGYYFCRKPYFIVKDDLKTLLDVGSDELAPIGMAFFITYMIGQFVTAYLGKFLSCRALLLVGMLGSAVCNVGFIIGTHAGLDGYWLFFVFMALNGIFQGTGWGSVVGVMAHWFRRSERGTVMAFWATCYMLGSVLAKNFSSFMFGVGLGDADVAAIPYETLQRAVSYAFLGPVAVLIAVWFLIFFFVKDRPEQYKLSPIIEERFAIEDVSSGKIQTKAQLGWTRQVWRTVITMGVAYFSFKFVRYGLDSWTPMIIKESFGSSTEAAGYASTVQDWGGFAGVIFAGVVTDRIFKSSRSALTFLMTFGLLLGCLFMWQYGTSSMTTFLIGLGVVGFMTAGPDSLLSGVGTIDVASKRGAVVAAAIVNGIGSAGSVMQEAAIGYLKEAYPADNGYSAVLTLLFCVATFGVFITLLLLRWKRAGRSDL